ncbi:MAG TPA: hypothetical protein VHV26_02830 [Rhizomicrobium sp.]|nr:hypothetical protein [Rhizomicrobium sp.]
MIARFAHPVAFNMEELEMNTPAFVNRPLSEEPFTLAEAHVRHGVKLVARQRELLKELERDGHDVRLAYALRDTFEQLQALHIEDRDRWIKELGAD